MWRFSSLIGNSIEALDGRIGTINEVLLNDDVGH